MLLTDGAVAFVHTPVTIMILVGTLLKWSSLITGIIVGCVEQNDQFGYTFI